ncbi:MAG: patatin family protein [Dialister sp.]|nr:patatin family protein [Dialister sp.]
MTKQFKKEYKLQAGEDTVLLLEGGAMRGIFTAGVLDAFMEKGLYFPRMIAISVGTLLGVCYMTGQKERILRVNIKFVKDRRYMGLHHLLRDGSYFNFRFMFGDIAHTLEPFDYEGFAEAKEEIFAIATACRNGRPVYFSNKDYDIDTFMKICEASCSIPLFSKPVKLKEESYVDGGVGMPLCPLPCEIPFPHEKLIYILTRDVSYRKKPVPRAFRSMMRAIYGRKFPAVAEEICTVPERYNERMEQLSKLEKEGRVFIIRPMKPTEVPWTESNPHKLMRLYGEGYHLGMKHFEELMRWLHGEN